jgi:hypothetical protein
MRHQSITYVIEYYSPDQVQLIHIQISRAKQYMSSSFNIFLNMMLDEFQIPTIVKKTIIYSPASSHDTIL